MRSIILRRELRFPRERVWAALTDRDALGAWLMPNDFEPTVGHAFTFRTDPAPGFDGTVHATVLRLDPPSCLEISWRGGPLDTTVRFELSETAGGGTLLILRHEGFAGLSNLIPRLVLGLGWRGLVRKDLPRYLEAHPPKPVAVTVGPP